MSKFELITAMVTPFTETGEVDYLALQTLTEHLILTGSEGLVVLGSTGENPTLSLSEKKQIIETVSRQIGERPITLIAGCGTNDTRTTLEQADLVIQAGADQLLVVSPYYNKPSQHGLRAHFQALCAHVNDIPVIAYNIPSRCGVTILPETLNELAHTCSNLVGVKQSLGDMDQVSDIRRLTRPSFRIWSGDDSLTLPMLALGACGVISVASHVVGKLMRTMLDLLEQGQSEKALQYHLQLMPVFRELFFLPNPTVLKVCLSNLGLIPSKQVRLPLVLPEKNEEERIALLCHMIHTLNEERDC
jgi:4-hydroxy-tetrahydrodipicolinate synthase